MSHLAHSGVQPIFRAILVGLLCALPIQAVSASSAPAMVASAPQAPQQGSAERPVVIDLAGSPVIRVEATDKTERHNDFTGPEWALVFVTGALALYTAMLYRATVRLGRDAKVTAHEQTERMERSIAEAGRAATAMEGVATATQANTHLMPSLLRKQMRAYVSVEMGVPTCQDEKLRFQGSPIITNNGFTPARNVSFKVLTGIFEVTPKNNLVLPPIGDLAINDMGLAPRQQTTITSVLDHRVPDGDLEAVMAGVTRRLFAWGKVTYDDVYGGAWETNFCFNYSFFTAKDPDGVTRMKFNSFYFPRHNNAT